MKILQISTQVFKCPPDGYGGLEGVCYDLAVELLKLGHQVAIVAPKGSNVPGAEMIMPCDPSPVNPEGVAYEAYKGRLAEFDIIHNHAWAAHAYLAKMDNPSLRVIDTIHSMQPWSSAPPVQFPCLVGASKYHAQLLSGIYGVHVEVVYHGIQLETYEPKPPFKPISERKYLLYVARIAPMKGSHEFVALCHKLKIPGIVVGEDQYVDDQKYVRRVMDSCDGKRVQYLGRVPRGSEQMVELMQNAKAVIAPLIPPYGEIFGLCVHPDTEIDTDKGIVTISNLNGARVLSGDGLYHEVKAKVARPYKGDLIKISPSGISFPVKTTPEHPYWAMRRHSQRFFTAPEWVPAKALKKGDMLLVPMLQEKVISAETIAVPSYKRNTRKRVVPDKIRLDRDFWTLAGYFLAEGWVQAKGHAMGFAFHKDETEIHQEVLSLFEKLFGIKGTIRSREGTKGIELNFNVYPIAQLFSTLFGKHSWEKHLPHELWPLSNEAAQSMLRSYFLGDGHFEKEGPKNYSGYILSTASPTLAHQVKHLLLRLGFVPCMGKYKGPVGRVIKGKVVKSTRHFYTVGVRGVQVGAFAKIVMRSNVEINTHREKIIQERFLYNNMLYLPIKKVGTELYEGDVWDIQVADSHCFTSGGTLLHNSTVETMSAGTPFISTDCGAAKELVVEGKTGFVVPSVNELEGAVQKLDTINPADCIARAQAFDRARMAKDYVALYERIIRGEPW